MKNWKIGTRIAAGFGAVIAGDSRGAAEPAGRKVRVPRAPQAAGGAAAAGLLQMRRAIQSGGAAIDLAPDRRPGDARDRDFAPYQA